MKQRRWAHCLIGEVVESSPGRHSVGNLPLSARGSSETALLPEHMERASSALNSRSQQPREAPVVLSTSWGAAALACVCQAIFWQTSLSESAVGTQFLSGGSWSALTKGLGARLVTLEGGLLVADPGPPLMWSMLASVGAAILLMGLCVGINRLCGLRASVHEGWRWWWWLGAWEALRLACDLCGWTSLGAVVVASASLVQVAAWSGFVATRLGVPVNEGDLPRRMWLGVPAAVWLLVAVYTATFFTLNWRLWETLLIPHGDSAMYEEHVWNLLHGKGFRSYLDQGRLFLGEHIQVIHVGLVPLYLLWPSHLLLEFAQSAALGLTAIPAWRLAQRSTGSDRAAILFAAAVLCYLPLQFLDIAIDFKTFRPNAFEIPFLLFGLDALERGKYRQFSVWAVLSLLCQEDAAPVLAPLGVWIALTRSSEPTGASFFTRRRMFGVGLALLATVYLLLVIKVILPWFRGGADVHFAQYFSDLGGSTSEIVWTVATQPWRLLAKWCQPDVGMFGILLFAPLGFAPLASPGRLLVAAPLFLVLALNQLSRSPVHHFHAPLVPIIVWAAAAGLGRGLQWTNVLKAMLRRNNSGPALKADEGKAIDPARRFPRDAIRSRPGKHLPAAKSVDGSSGNDSTRAQLEPRTEISRSSSEDASHPMDVGHPVFLDTLWWGRFVCGCSLGLMVLTGFTPAGIPFWDPGSRAYWRNLYLETPRSHAARAVVEAIPASDRVASTDFIHPRFTHHERSYDYSDYRPEVPPDANWIVIDTGHPYSQIKTPEQVKEFVRTPGEWKLVPVDPDGWFLVFRRVE